MLDRLIQPKITKFLTYFCRYFAHAGLRPNHLTALGLGFALGAFGALAMGWFYAALVCILGNRFCDGCDGVLARMTGHSTPEGAFYDSVADFIFYGLVPLGFAVHDAQNALASAVLLFSFLGTGTGFLNFALWAQARKITDEFSQKKGFFYGIGLMEGSETLFFFVFFCIFPEDFNQDAYIFAGLCALTIGQRILQIIRFSQK